MHYAIIAAGEGSRLREEGVTQPKPLVPIEGIPMIDRLLGIMCRCGAESISIICNAEMTAVQQHLRRYIAEHAQQVPMQLVVESTPSSMHSLARLSQVIPAGKVCVTTVDTIFREQDFAAFIRSFEQTQGGLFAVTSFVDDEKPLWVGACPVDGALSICGFYDKLEQMPSHEQRLVSGGIYGLETQTAWPVLQQCLAQGQSRMRNYQRALIQAGVKLQAYVFDKIMDIDHASDIAKAEQWLATAHLRVLAVRRAPEHSPNNVSKDAAILQAVTERLQQQGIAVDSIGEETLAERSLDSFSGYSLVLHMARRFKSLHRLSQLSQPVINPSTGVSILAKSREMTLTRLQLAGVEVPRWWAYDPEEDQMFLCEPELQQLLPGWVKATRAEGAQAEDVQWVATPLEADSRVMELAAQRVADIVLMRHETGDLLKVYCVAGEDGLHLWTFYPQSQGYSKFGQAEAHNTPLAHLDYDRAALERIASSIVQAFGVQVFGFDVIVTPDHRLVVIDVNDWPSFSACRQEAAQAIAQLVISKL